MANKNERLSGKTNQRREQEQKTAANVGKPNKGNDPFRVSESNEAEAERKARQGQRASAKEGRLGADTGSREAFEQSQPGDKLADVEELKELRSRSQVYRDRYSEVMRDFYAGQLRGGTSNHVVTDSTEAQSIAKAQAALAELAQEPND